MAGGTAGKVKKTAKRIKKNPCDGCDARCCHDLAMLVFRPRTKTEREEIEWYLHFDTVSVFIRNHRWYLLIKGRCIYLDANNRCSIYARRSARCRRHHPDTCERHASYYDVLLTTPEELRAYLDHISLPAAKRNSRSRHVAK